MNTRRGKPFSITAWQAAALALVAITPSVAREIPFAAPAPVAIGIDGAIVVQAADLDRDGDLDLLSGSASDSSIRWHENTGGSPPTFVTRTLSALAPGVSDLQAADLDRDGDVDVLASSAGNDTVAWFKNNGAVPPGFTRVTISTTADGASSVWAADLDGDGNTDVLSASALDDRIAWYENTGSSFVVRTIAADADGASAVHAADLDRDGDLDVAAASALDDSLAWYENLGGAPPAFAVHALDATADGARSVVAADMDLDGDPDLVASSTGDQTIAWYENLGGTPPTFAMHLITASAFDVGAVLAADLDGDSDPDVVSCSSSDGQITWHENQRGSPPAFAERTIATDVSGARAVHAGDIDGDGDLDVLSAAFDSDTLVLHENRTIHRRVAFRPVQSLPITGVFEIRDVAVADLDRDGDVDLVATTGTAATLPRIRWFENQGDNPPSFVARVLADLRPDALRTADIDRDGHIDVLAAVSGSIAWFENDGQAPPSFTQRIIAATDVETVQPSDLDRDGDIDVAMTGEGGRLAWYENVGGTPPAFVAHEVSTTSDDPSLDVADMNGDGWPDLLLVFNQPWPNVVVVWQSNGGSPPQFGIKQVPVNFGLGRGGSAPDLDGDGDRDILLHYPLNIVWLEHDGPEFVHHDVLVAPLPSRVFATDLDGDRDLDIFMAAPLNGTTRWFENDGASPPSFALRSGPGSSSVDVAAADLDRDGRTDLASTVDAGSGSVSVAWQLNAGGQFELSTTNTSPTLVGNATTSAVLKIVATHNGRAGDGDAELVTFALRFEEHPGDPLTVAELEALLESLRIHRDDGSGQFEPAADPLVAELDAFPLAQGVLEVAFADGDPELQLATQASRTYFVVVETSANAQGQEPGMFHVTHLTESSTAEDRDFDIPLMAQYGPDVSACVVAAAALGGVPDGASVPGEPLRLTKSGFDAQRAGGTTVLLTWGAACGTQASDYAIYRGTLGEFTTHRRWVCSTGGATEWSFETFFFESDVYYLVVPRNECVEGSYGLSSAGERPQGILACAPRGLSTCP